MHAALSLAMAPHAFSLCELRGTPICRPRVRVPRVTRWGSWQIGAHLGVTRSELQHSPPGIDKECGYLLLANPGSESKGNPKVAQTRLDSINRGAGQPESFSVDEGLLPGAYLVRCCPVVPFCFFLFFPGEGSPSRLQKNRA